MEVKRYEYCPGNGARYWVLLAIDLKAGRWMMAREAPFQCLVESGFIWTRHEMVNADYFVEKMGLLSRPSDAAAFVHLARCLNLVRNGRFLEFDSVEDYEEKSGRDFRLLGECFQEIGWL